MVLAILGVALGVAVAVAVDLANTSAERAFRLSMASLTGEATHQIIGGATGVDERLYTRLRIDAGLRAGAPVVEAYGKSGDETLHVLGVDPFAEQNIRGHLNGISEVALPRLLSHPNTVLMADLTARRLGLAPGGRFTLRLGGRRTEVELTGVLATSARTAAALDGLVITDIATAQELAGVVGRLSWIDLVLPEGEQGKDLRRRVERLLPPEVTLVAAAARTEAMTQMTRAFHINLTAMSLLALLVGVFLIYNTMTFAVLQRRGLIGTLRVLGVTRAEIFRVMLGEAVLIGVVGTVLGIVIGIMLGQGLVRLVTRTIDDLYFALTVGSLLLTPAPLIKGSLMGLGATLLAALAPAMEAATTVPRTALTRSELEGRVRSLAPRLALLGALLALGALVILLLPTRDLVTGFVSLFMLILGMTLITPVIVAGVTRLLAPVAGRLFGIQARLAIRGIAASLSRTGVAIAALMLAVSTTVGVGVMVSSFRSTVALWLDATLRADIYISAPSLRSSRTASQLDPQIVQHVRAVPGIEAIASGRSVIVESEHGLTEVFALDRPPGRGPRYLLRAGDPAAVWQAFGANEAVLVSEPYAYRHGIGIGDRVRLRTDDGERTFPVAGVYYDYESGPGVVLMNRELYERHYRDRAIGALGLYLRPHAAMDEVMAALRTALGGGQEVLIRSNREIRQASLEIFDRTFTITNVLRLLSILVAFIGILSALMALQLERAKELAVLRATGFTPVQVTGLVTVQTGFMGLVAGVLAVPVGLVMSLILIHVINRRAFGWSMQTLVPADVLIQAVLLALLAALIAGLYPGWRMARTRPAAALREE